MTELLCVDSITYAMVCTCLFCRTCRQWIFPHLDSFNSTDSRHKSLDLALQLTRIGQRKNYPKGTLFPGQLSAFTDIDVLLAGAQQMTKSLHTCSIWNIPVEPCVWLHSELHLETNILLAMCLFITIGIAIVGCLTMFVLYIIRLI